MERPVRLADPDVAGVGAFGDGGEGELWSQLCREVFERVDGEIDSAFFQCFFDLLDEDAFAVEIWGCYEAWLLQAVAGGADDFEFDTIAGVPESVEDVVGLPEGELRASAADADGVAGVVVLATHVFLGYGMRGSLFHPGLSHKRRRNGRERRLQQTRSFKRRMASL